MTEKKGISSDMMCEKNIRSVDVIVPCFNEEENLDAFFEESRRVFESMEGYDFRYIFIDDGSTDDTLEKIKNIAEKWGRGSGEYAGDCGSVKDFDIRYISFSRNFGKEAAMYAGLRASKRDLAVIIDADLQHPPELIKKMAEKLEATGCDICAARRVSRKGEPKIRSVFARAFYKLMNRYSDIEIADGVLDFRLMKRKVVKAVMSMPETQRFSKGIFAWVGFDTEWVEFENVKRLSGESKWSAWRLTKYAIDGFIDFAASPLKFTGVFGCVTAVCSAVYLIVEIIKTLAFGKDTPGYASTICLILFFGGLIIAILSLMGEYIGRMYMETKGRPVYIEKESNIDED